MPRQGRKGARMGSWTCPTGKMAPPRPPANMPPSWRDVRRPRRVAGRVTAAPGPQYREPAPQRAVQAEHERNQKAVESIMVSLAFLAPLVLMIVAGLRKPGRRRRRRSR